MSAATASAATATTSAASGSNRSATLFQSKCLVHVIPNDARNKKAIREVVQVFGEQFAHALARNLRALCELRRTKTVDMKAMRQAADDLLGDGAHAMPAGTSEEALPQTLVFARFKKLLGGLRTEKGCANMISVVGFNFLRHVGGILRELFEAAESPSSISMSDVSRALATPRGYGRSGAPCIAYRPDLGVPVVAVVADEADDAEAEAEAEAEPVAAPAPAAPKKVKAVKAASAAPRPATASRKRPAKAAGKSEEAAALDADFAEPEAAAAAAPASAEKKSRKKRTAVKAE